MHWHKRPPAKALAQTHKAIKADAKHKFNLKVFMIPRKEHIISHSPLDG